MVKKPNIQSLQLSPIPANQQLLLSFELAKPSAVLATLVDYQGKIIRQTNLGFLGKGIQAAVLNIEGLSAGTYILYLSAGQSQVAEQFLKQ